MRETGRDGFQSRLIHHVRERVPGVFVMKNDPTYIQGVPDLIFLNGPNWAMIECKRSERAPHRPNQDDYVEMLNSMSFAAFAYPENERNILDALQRTLGA